MWSTVGASHLYRGPNVLVLLLVLVLVLVLVLHISLKILEKVLPRQFQDIPLNIDYLSI